MTHPDKIQLIGIHGHAGVGKDTLAKYIYQHHNNTYREAFADPLKQACSHAFGIPIENFNDPELKSIRHPYWEVSPREIAQFVGTEMFRDKIHSLTAQKQWSHWVRRLAGKISGDILLDDEGTYQPGDTVIIPDVRFQDEVDFIISNDGVIITIQRSGYEGNVGISKHASEAGGLSIPHPYSYTILNSGSIPDMFNCFEAILPAMRTLNNITLFKS
jgi:hypothetical protein